MRADMNLVRLDYKPREWQLRCHTSLTRFSVLVLHRRAGKTELAIVHLIKHALDFKQDLGLFVYVAPFLKQAKAIAWARLKQKLRALEAQGAVNINESELSVQFLHNGATIRLFGADNPDAMRGIRLDGAVLDEVAQMKPETWVDIIQPALADRKGFAMFIGTPNGVNLFSELYYYAQNNPQWFAGLWTVYDTEALDPAEIERLKDSMSDIAFAREFLCDFTASGADQLMSLAQVNEAMDRQYTAADITHAPRILGVDPARFGDDSTAVCYRQGLQVQKFDVWHGLDSMSVAGRVAHIIDTWYPDAVFIDIGMGAGVIDRLKQLGYDQIIEVNFGSAASDPRFINKRTEIWWTVADALRLGLALPRDNQLAQDLAAPTYKYDARSRIVLESKDDIKKRGLPSPDRGDALALTYAHPVEKRLSVDIGLNGLPKLMPNSYNDTRRRTREYDPYANL